MFNTTLNIYDYDKYVLVSETTYRNSAALHQYRRIFDCIDDIAFAPYFCMKGASLHYKKIFQKISSKHI